MIQVRLKISGGAIPVQRQLSYALQQVGVHMTATPILHERGAYEAVWTAKTKKALEEGHRVATHYQFELREFATS